MARARSELARTGSVYHVNGEATRRAPNPQVREAPAFDSTAEDKHHARDALLRLLVGQTDSWVAAHLVDGVVQLDPTAEDKRQACDVLLRLLASLANGSLAGRLVGRVVQLEPTAENRSQARVALLRLLASEADSGVARDLVGSLVPLSPTIHDLSACVGVRPHVSVGVLPDVSAGGGSGGLIMACAGLCRWRDSGFSCASWGR